MRTAAIGATLLALLLTSQAAQARPLVERAAGAADLPEHGIRNRTLLRLDAGALARLRERSQAQVEGFPLGAGRDVTLDLVRTRPLERARLEEWSARGVQRLAEPSTAYFIGAVRGEPGSRVLLAAGTSRVRGFVVSGGTAFLFGPDAHGTMRTYDLRDVDEQVHPARAAFCDGDLYAALVHPPTALREAAAAAPAPAAFSGQMLRLDLAIETDLELRAKFASSTEALDYIAALVAAANTIYERDLGLHLNASYVRLWSGSDPWVRTSTDGQLDELQDYWTNPSNSMLAIAGPRAAVHMLSGKTVTGGIAYIAAVCDNNWGFGVSQVDGGFDLAFPSQIWDVVVFSHELGHNVGSEHSHCYSPPLDRCFNQEPGCYSGTVVASHGSIMSYCHTLPGGLANIDLLFPSPIVSVVRQTAASASCLQPLGPVPCGNGTLDPGEDCDDGNTTAGDGCSAFCMAEECGNGIKDPGEECDDHNTTSGDGCTPLCKAEVCGNGVLDAGEQCDDGNAQSQDGCAPNCTIEHCPILIGHQRDWTGGQLVIEPGTPGGERLSLKGTFGVPGTAPVDPAAAGMTILFADPKGAVTFSAILPGGAGWKQRGERVTYRDRRGSVAGIRKATLRIHRGGPVSRVKLAVHGVGGGYPDALAGMPRQVTVLLGDAAAVAGGGCGSRTFNVAACRSVRDGRKLLCR